jgi:hypothetical protein
LEALTKSAMFASLRRWRQAGLSSSLAGALACAVLFLLPPAAAQDFALDWYTIAGGGGYSSGGQYTLKGTIGQPAASPVLSGDSFALLPGFWGIAVSTEIGPPGDPELGAAYDPVAGTFTVFWPRRAEGWVLQAAAELLGPATHWFDLLPPYPSTASSYYLSAPFPAGVRFYRLRSPNSP